MLDKVASGTISREEGSLFLNDLMKRGSRKDALRKLLLNLCQSPPLGLCVKTLYHVIALSDNSDFRAILKTGLEHPDEEICIVSAEGLSKYHSGVAQETLVRHLVNPSYHVRKASGNSLIKGWGKEGAKMVATYGLCHPELLIRDTAATALVKSGEVGVTALVDALELADTNAVGSAADALIGARDFIKAEHVPKIIHALVSAADQKSIDTILTLLNLLGALKSLAAGYEEYIAHMMYSGYRSVSASARAALIDIGTGKAVTLLETRLNISLRRRLAW